MDADNYFYLRFVDEALLQDYSIRAYVPCANTYELVCGGDLKKHLPVWAWILIAIGGVYT